MVESVKNHQLNKDKQIRSFLENWEIPIILALPRGWDLTLSGGLIQAPDVVNLDVFLVA